MRGARGPVTLAGVSVNDHRAEPRSGFSDVDGTGAPERYAAYLESACRLGTLEASKRWRDSLLSLDTGDRAIDVGCGLGDDARALGRLVGSTGQVVGVDASKALIERARGRVCVEDGRVEFIVGDAHALPFTDSTFDAARIERTLQHVADPRRVVAEMVRLTRPGGVVLGCEPDWATIVVSGVSGALAHGIRATFAAAIRHASVGRELAGLLRDQGVVEIAVEAETLIIRDAAVARAGFDLPTLVARLVDDGRASLSDAEAMLAGLERDSADGRLVAALTLFTAWGRVPLRG
jgi:SAM-dependent methyltransferase